jgi:hypothetical protein
MVKLVVENPKYQLALATLKEGVPIIQIASHFADNAWITVNERTFAEALRTYRRLHQDHIDNFQPDSIDKYVDANSPNIDVESALSQMLRLQKERIAIDYRHEKEMGKLFDTTHREIKTFGEIAELMLKTQGKVSGTGGPVRRSGEATPQDVNDNLALIKKDQNTQDRLHGLTRQLVEAKS